MNGGVIDECVGAFDAAFSKFLEAYGDLSELDQLLIGNRLKQKFEYTANVERLATLARLTAGLPTCMNCGLSDVECLCDDNARIENGD